MARAAVTAADLLRTATSAISAKEVYAQKCSTFWLTGSLPIARTTGDLAGNSEPTAAQQMTTAQRTMSTVRLFCSRGILSFIGAY